MSKTTKVVDREYLRRQFKNFNDTTVKPQLNNKVDKVAGYGLSKNDFTDALKTKLEGLQNYDDTAVVNAINTLNGDVNTEGSVAKTTADAVAAIIASAPSDFDTLKEISDWISSHADSAAAMNSQIQANTAAIATLNGDENTTGSVAHSVKEAVDSLAYEIENVDIDFSNLDNIVISGVNDGGYHIGEQDTLIADPSDGVSWSSSDDEVATVTSAGVVTAVAAGTATITASKLGFTAGTAQITVLANSTMYIQPDDSYEGDGIKLVAIDFDSKEAIESGVTWSSSDDSVATVDSNGVVTQIDTETQVTITASKIGYDNATYQITASN